MVAPGRVRYEKFHCNYSLLSIILDGQPGLTELQQLTTKEGKSLNLLQDVGAKYEGFGTCLLDDTYGSKMDTIRSDHHTVETKMRNIFTNWLQGKI